MTTTPRTCSTLVALPLLLLPGLALGDAPEATGPAPWGDALQVAQQTPERVLRRGTTPGELSASDPQSPSGQYEQTWWYEGQAGERVTFTMESPAFDTVLRVRGPGGVQAENDDRAPGDLNSAVMLTLPMHGRYQVQATSYRPGAMGAFTLTVGDAAAGPGPAAGGSGDAQTRPVAVGQTVEGRLEPGDSQLNSGEFADTWLLEGQAGHAVRVDMDSSDFDPYLLMRGPSGFAQDNDDRASGDLNATLEVTLPVAGTYRVVATSYAPGERGAYTLRVSADGSRPASVSGADSRLTGGALVTGELSSDDPVRGHRHHYDVYTFVGEPQLRVSLRAEADGYPVHLRLIHPDGAESTQQADRPGEAVTLHEVLRTAGEYTLHVGSATPGSLGPYGVSLTTARVPQAAAAAGASALRPDTALEGRLQASDPRLDTGEHFVVHTWEARAGEVATFTLESTSFDPYLMVRGHGLQLDNDDAPDMGLNSRLEVVFPVDGTYQVTVTSYAAGETGPYVLRARSGSALQGSGSGRVFGVLVGINEYTRAGRLTGCAEDARSLFSTLQQTGLLAPESVALTDAMATRQAVRDAFARVGRAMGPDDLFLFFFSGHGSQTPGRELDGFDETLVLIDGEMIDDEVGSLFDGIQGRVSLIALDACFSGGFARDVISAPDRMGLFSSEEDVTSNVAARFAAGGYLSYFLRDALAGAADIDPADGVITAGELAQYMRRQWAAHMEHERAETSTSERAWQNLVIDRGSVKMTDIILYRQAR
jgi:plastocyanin